MHEFQTLLEGSQRHESMYGAHDSIYRIFWITANDKDKSQISGCQGLGRGLITRDKRELDVVMSFLYLLVVVVVTIQLYRFAKTHPTTHEKGRYC